MIGVEFKAMPSHTNMLVLSSYCATAAKVRKSLPQTQASCGVFLNKLWMCSKKYSLVRCNSTFHISNFIICFLR